MLCYGTIFISLSLPQKRALRLWLAYQRRCGSSKAEDTEARLRELCAAEGWSPDGSEDEEEEMDNSEPLDDSDVVLSDSGRQHQASTGEHSPTLTSLLKY